MIRKLILVLFSSVFLAGCISSPPPDHHTEEVYRIAHSTSSRERFVADCAELGFNVVHTNDTRRMDAESILVFLDTCEANGVMGFPRIDRGPNVEEIIEGIKDHPALLAVGSDDEAEGERVPLEEQYRYYAQVKSVAPDLQVWRNWNGSSEGHSWDEYFPPKDRIKDSCDKVLLAVYPWGIWGNPPRFDPDGWVESERNRALPYLNSDTPLIPIMQGYYGGGWRQPDMEMQWGFWSDICNSYAIWLYRPDPPSYTGFEKSPLREEVKKLNKGVR